MHLTRMTIRVGQTKSGRSELTEVSGMRHWIAVNMYRSGTDTGFANTWNICECESREVRQRMLSDGLLAPYGGGSFGKIETTRGLRPITRAEHAQRLREEKQGNDWHVVYGVLSNGDIGVVAPDWAVA